MNKVLALEVIFDFGNGLNKIYPTILKDDQEMILIDCGYPNFLHLIKKAAEAKGLNIEDLTKIIITHHDFDHMGSLAEFKREYPRIQILSSIEEEMYVNGREKSLRLQQAEALFDYLPEDKKPEAESFHNLLRSVKAVNVDLLLKNGDKFPWCKGTEIISTPGHMPGHISLYVKESKTLISGDALVIENDELAIANPSYTLDLVEAKKSIKKLLNYDIETIICYHGGLYRGNIEASLKKLL